VAGNKKVQYIPAKPSKREKRIGIYARVSTNSAEQLKSLTAQIWHLTRLTVANQKWLLVDVYMNIASGKVGSSRKEFSRMLKDCQSHDLEIIFTKGISRFGRDTVEILDARDIFEQEELDTTNIDSDLMISIIESIARAENESRSDNIKWGINQHARNGTSKLYNKMCYSYTNASDGSLVIEDAEAETVKLSYKSDDIAFIERYAFVSPEDDNKF